MNALRFITVCATLGAYETEVLRETSYSHHDTLQKNPNRGKGEGLWNVQNMQLYRASAENFLTKQPLSIGS